MKKAPFAVTLVRKSERALKVARLALNAGDNDSAVSRSYYSMFDIARAALLRAGVTEDKLPRTHSGVIEAFRNHAVESGQIDRQLAAQLSRTVERAFGLDESSLANEYENPGSMGDDKVSEPAVAVSEIKGKCAKVEPTSLEEIRRQARENWLQLRQQKTGVAIEVDHSKDADRDTREDQSRSFDDDVGE